MHHSHPDLAVFLIVFGSVLVFTVVVVAVAVRWRQRLYAGPLQEQWHEARRGLTSRQRCQVWWANMRHRPVTHPELGTAQLAYTRYAADAYRRAPMTRHRWIRITIPAMEFAAAAFQLIPALLSPQARIAHLITGGLFLLVALIWVYLVVRGLPKAEQKLTNLQQQLQHRFGPREDVALCPRQVHGGVIVRGGGICSAAAMPSYPVAANAIT